MFGIDDAIALPIVGNLIGDITGGGKKGSSGGSNWITDLLFPGMEAAGMISSSIAKKKALRNSPSPVDYNQQLMLNNLRDKQRSLESGAAYLPQQEAIKEAGRSTANAATRLSGGNVGATIGALNRINRSTGRNLNELYGNMSMEGLQMTNIMNQLVQQMANRSLNVQVGNQAQQLADAVKQKQGYQQGLVSSLANSNLGEMNPQSRTSQPKSQYVPPVPTLDIGYEDVTNQPLIGNGIRPQSEDMENAIGAIQLPE